MRKRLGCIISGRVQGVLFRDFARRRANKLGLLGFVRNVSDGTVEVVAEGEETFLRTLLKALRHGPSFARVESVEESWSEATDEFDDFRISLSSFFDRF